LNKHEIARYFRVLSKLYRKPCKIILTGAAAGALYGRIRATLDLDFALRFPARSPARKEMSWREFAACAHEATERTGIAAQYAEDIDRWSLISYLDYEKHTLPFSRFGKIEARLLKPSFWAIGKLARYLDPDVRDVCEVMKRTRTRAEGLARVLGRALRRSPKSTACELFRRQVEDFFKTRGRGIWGKNYRSEKTIAIFRRYAG
jgi:hypothetical protein